MKIQQIIATVTHNVLGMTQIQGHGKQMDVLHIILRVVMYTVNAII